jgi:hypothetical protein
MRSCRRFGDQVRQEYLAAGKGDFSLSAGGRWLLNWKAMKLFEEFLEGKGHVRPVLRGIPYGLKPEIAVFPRPQRVHPPIRSIYHRHRSGSNDYHVNIVCSARAELVRVSRFFQAIMLARVLSSMVQLALIISDSVVPDYPARPSIERSLHEHRSG